MEVLKNDSSVSKQNLKQGVHVFLVRALRSLEIYFNYMSSPATRGNSDLSDFAK